MDPNRPAPKTAGEQMKWPIGARFDGPSEELAGPFLDGMRRRNLSVMNREHGSPQPGTVVQIQAFSGCVIATAPRKPYRQRISWLAR